MTVPRDAEPCEARRWLDQGAEMSLARCRPCSVCGRPTARTNNGRPWCGGDRFTPRELILPKDPSEAQREASRRAQEKATQAAREAEALQRRNAEQERQRQAERDRLAQEAREEEARRRRAERDDRMAAAAEEDRRRRNAEQDRRNNRGGRG